MSTRVLRLKRPSFRDPSGQSFVYTGCFTVSVPTLIAYFSDISQYFRISFLPLNHIGGGFCLKYETPWYVQGCLRKLQNEFLADSRFLWFFALLWIFVSSFGPPMARYRLTWWSVIKYSTIEIKFFISLGCNLSRVVKIDFKSSKLSKKAKKWNFSQNSNLLFSWASLHVSGCFIPQTKSPTYVIKWLKGYSEIFTYIREISNQSWDTNRETPCRLRYPNIQARNKSLQNIAKQDPGRSRQKS